LVSEPTLEIISKLAETIEVVDMLSQEEKIEYEAKILKDRESYKAYLQKRKFIKKNKQ
jgi:hypothetical protein